MTISDLIKALQRLKVETGSIACLGCGHERNCGIYGCAIIREAAERLGSFNAVNAVFNEDTIVRLADRCLKVEPGRLRELAEADRDGRLVVLPCKVGDTLWVTGRDNVPRKMSLEAPDIRTVCTDEDNLCMSTCNRKPDGFCAYRLRNDGADIGKTVFLTREEAEKALEAMKDE